MPAWGKSAWCRCRRWHGRLASAGLLRAHSGSRAPWDGRDGSHPNGKVTGAHRRGGSGWSRSTGDPTAGGGQPPPAACCRFDGTSAGAMLPATATTIVPSGCRIRQAPSRCGGRMRSTTSSSCSITTSARAGGDEAAPSSSTSRVTDWRRPKAVLRCRARIWFGCLPCCLVARFSRSAVPHGGGHKKREPEVSSGSLSFEHVGGLGRSRARVGVVGSVVVSALAVLGDVETLALAIFGRAQAQDDIDDLEDDRGTDA